MRANGGKISFNSRQPLQWTSEIKRAANGNKKIKKTNKNIKHEKQQQFIVALILNASQ